MSAPIGSLNYTLLRAKAHGRRGARHLAEANATLARIQVTDPPGPLARATANVERLESFAAEKRRDMYPCAVSECGHWAGGCKIGRTQRTCEIAEEVNHV